MSNCSKCCKNSAHPDWYYCATVTACNGCSYPVSLQPPSPTPQWPPQVITPGGGGPRPRINTQEDPEIVAAFKRLADDYTPQNALVLAKLLESRDDYRGALTVAELTANSFEDNNWFQEQIDIVKWDVRVASVNVSDLSPNDIGSILRNFEGSHQLSADDILPLVKLVPGVTNPAVTAATIADAFNSTVRFDEVP